MAEPPRLLSSLVFASTLRRLGIEVTLAPTGVLLGRIRAGERADAALLTREGAEALVAEGVLEAGSLRDLARSRVGIAVRRGAPHPPIATEAELVATLRAARSVGVSRTGASGLFFAELLDRLGLSAAVMAKAVVIEQGFTASLLADGRAELAVQQVSELLAVAGAEVVGPLPPECGGESVFSGAVFRGAADPAAAGVLLARIAGAEAILREGGLAPA